MEEKEKTLEVTQEESTEVQVEEENAEVKEDEPKKENKVLSFLITTLNGMAYGLFATLIIGTIIATIGSFFPAPVVGEDGNVGTFLNTVICNGAKALQNLTGAGIGVGIAIALKKKPLETVVLAGVGELAGYFSLSTKFVTEGVVNNGTFQIGILKDGKWLNYYLIDQNKNVYVNSNNSFIKQNIIYNNKKYI